MRIWLFLFLLLVAPSHRAAIRLAILPQSPAVTSVADLLTASFSKLPDTQILERSDLNKILQERALTATQSNNALTAAALLGADSLLLIEPARLGTNNSAILRLVSVKNGAVISSLQRRWPMDEADKWTASVTNHFAPLLPKISLPADRLIKISLLNLRSPSSSTVSKLLDRELTTLLRIRLAREPEIILLERQDLASLAMEKDLAASTERFWTGSHLLDGAINRDGIKPGLVTLNLRLIAPGASPHEIALEATSTNLVAAADRIATELLKRLQRSSAVHYDPISEASAFLEEAEWSLRWQMHPEAIAAADSAWALGSRTLTVGAARILAHARAGSDSPHVGVYTSTTSGAFRFGFSYPDFPPHPQALKNMTDALQIGLEMVQLFSTNLAVHIPAYESLCEALAHTGEALGSYYHATELREGHELELAELRKLARQLGATLMNDPPLQPTRLTHGDVYRSRPLNGPYSDIFGVMAAYGVYFNETPEQTADLYRELFSKHTSPRYDSIFGSRGFVRNRPLVGGWKWEDRRRTRVVLEKLASENLPRVNNGKFFEALNEDLGVRGFSPMPSGFRPAVTPVTTPLRPPTPLTNRIPSVVSATTNREIEMRERILQGMPPEIRERMKARMDIARAAMGTNRHTAPPPVQVQTANPAEKTILVAPILNTADFWSVPTNWVLQRWPTARSSHPKIRDGQLWLRATFSFQFTESNENGARIGYRTTNALITVDPATLRHQIIPLPRPEFDGDITGNNPNDNGHFEVSSNAFYFVHGDTLLRRERDRDQWTVSPLPSVNGVLYKVHDRLLLSGDEGIYEILENGSKAKTLASIRRRPPQSIVDELPALQKPDLLPGPNGALRLALKNALYIFDGSGWRNELSGVTQLKHSDENHVFYQKPRSSGLWVKPNSNESMAFVQAAGLRGARWTLNLIPSDLLFTYKGQPAVLSSARLEAPRPPDQSGWLFYFFPESAPLPVEIPVNFMTDRSDLPNVNQKTGWMYRLGKHQKVIETETHLLIFPGSMYSYATPEFLGGFWMIPKTQIDERIRNALAKN